jgi:hypothetical protein
MTFEAKQQIEHCIAANKHPEAPACVELRTWKGKHTGLKWQVAEMT